MIDFLFASIELFAIYYGSGAIGEMSTTRLFSQRGRSFLLKFYLDWVVPHQPFLAAEN